MPQKKGDNRPPIRFPKTSAITIWSGDIRASATSRRATSPRAPRRRCATKAAASVQAGSAFISISRMPSSGLGEKVIEERYGNLFDMYEQITGENPYKVPMRIYPAMHYTMGGLWVDYNLMSTIPGLFVLGEANFSDHGANRLGASALMQGLADGYFVIPYTIGNYLASTKLEQVDSRSSGVQSGRSERGRRMITETALDQRQAHRRFIPSRTRQDHVGQLRHGPQRRGLEDGASAAFRNCARSSGRT